MDKRGQAAMEFLITYGWAILAAIVAIGVLAFFLANPGRFTSNSCILTAPFTCPEYVVNDTGVTLVLRNGAAENYEVSLMNATCTSCGSGGTPSSCVTSSVQQITAGGTQTFSLGGASCTGLSGDTFRGDVVIIYKPTSGTLNQTMAGTLTYRVP